MISVYLNHAGSKGAIINMRELKLNLTEDAVVELYKKCSISLPDDVIVALKRALREEENFLAKKVLEIILENICISEKEKRPICQDTGTPVFYVKCPPHVKQSEIKRIIENATIKATESIPLRPNAVMPFTGKNIGNSATVNFKEADYFRIDLLMKGGGSENIGNVYSLPNQSLRANRDIDGVKKCVFDAVAAAQGTGCPPYVIGVSVGGTREEAAALSKEQLLRKLDDFADDQILSRLEKDLLVAINGLGIGPSGFGGRTTALAVKAASQYRHPASFFVGIAFGCWALRRGCINYE